MSIWVTKKRALRGVEIPRYNYGKELGADTLMLDFPIRLSDELRANSDGVTCCMLGRGNETASSDRYEVREVFIEAWLSGEGRRYRRKLFMKVQRLFPTQVNRTRRK